MAARAKKEEIAVENGRVYVLRAGMPLYVKTADLCAMTGKSNQWIGQLTAQGILNKETTAHGPMYELRKSFKDYCDMLTERAPERDEDAEATERKRMEAESKIKQAKAVIAVMEASELQGKMHRSEDVADLVSDLIYAIRGMLIALPGRLAVDVAASEDAAEAAIIIRDEVHKLMEELSKYKYDPRKYEEKVRERKAWETLDGDEED